MRTYLINEEDLKKIVYKAFSSGENWGATYSKWFTPKESDTEKEKKEALTSAKRSTAKRIHTQ